MKTPEEIKKGLELHSSNAARCRYGCPYYGCDVERLCSEVLAADTLAYIQQLESQLKKVKHELELALWDSPPMGGFKDD